MSHTLSHTSILQASINEIWEACKHMENIFVSLLPQYFASSKFLEGHGEPRSIRFVTMGSVTMDSAISNAVSLKERIDKIDDTTKTIGYTLLEGDARYNTFSSEIHFEAIDDTQTKATWTTKFTPIGHMGPPEDVKDVVELVFKAMEKVVHDKRTFTHTETLDVSPNVVWKAFKHADEILLKDLPQYFKSSTYIEGQGGPGTVRLVKFGPAIQFAEGMTERIDFIDMEGKKMGYTVLKGDPCYKYFAATIEFKARPSKGTTNVVWVATYVTSDDKDVPPVQVRDVVVMVWKTLAIAAKANLERYG